MTEIPTLRTERLVLRPFREDDLDAWAGIVSDEETTQFIGGVRSREEAWRTIAMYLGHWTLRGFGQWAVERRLDGQLVGRAGLWYPEGWPALEVGWTFDRSVWGEGFATEAGRAAMDWAFGPLGLPRISAVIDRENSRSRAVAVRLGMELDREDELDGQPVVIYACDAGAT